MKHVVLALRAAAVLVALSALLSAAQGQQPEQPFPQVVHVPRTYDARPFSYRIESRRQKTRFDVLRLTYPSPVVTEVEQNNTVPAEYYLPHNIRPGARSARPTDDPKRPAVICLHILEGDFALARLTCSALASRGIPAIWFKLPYYGERGLPDGPRALAANPRLFVSALSQAGQDVRRTVDLLASRPEVDPERIGICGISLGGITAATAAAIEPRLSRAALILTGGQLKTIIHHARETRELSQLIRRLPPDERAEVEEAIDAVDPLRHAERLRARAQAGGVLMVNAEEDEVIPRSCSEKLAAALGIADDVIWLEGLGHYTAMAELPRVLETTVAFFAQDLPPGLAIEPPAAGPKNATELVASLLGQAAAFLTSEPQPGRCHHVDISGGWLQAGKEPVQGRLRFVRGHGSRFKLEMDVPSFGSGLIGQCEYPWMASGDKIVFKGVHPPGTEPAGPLAFADPRHIDKLRMAAGAIGAFALAPSLLETFCTVTEESEAGGRREIRVVLTATKQEVGLALRSDGKTPHRLTYDSGDGRLTLTFYAWQTDTVAHETMFRPAPELPEKQVDADDLYRMFAALFHFALESLE